LIIGGGAAGMTSAVQIKKKNPDMDVIVFEKSERVGWAGCPTPYWIQDELINNHTLGSDGSKFQEKGIKVLTSHSIERIDHIHKLIYGSNKMGSFKESYDKLVVTVGGKPFIPPIENYSTDLRNTFRLAHADDAIKIKDYITQNQPKKAIVIGAGFIGIEMVESFNNLGIDVTLVEKATSVLPRVDDELKDSITQELDKQDILVYTNTSIKKLIVEEDVVTGGVLEDDTVINTDLVLVSIGVRPNTGLWTDSGLELHDKRIKVNEYFETDYPDIYALGDLVLVKNQQTSQLTYAPFGDAANKQSFILADYLKGVERPYKGVYGAYATSFYDIKIAGVGLTKKEALKLGYEVDVITVAGLDKIGSFKDVKKVKATFVVDKKHKKILGSTFIGNGPVAQFNDQVSLVIYNDMKIEELIHVDFGYSPTTAVVWNPLLALYRKVIK
jgi:NADPH-dependent 2,4-dienoyl-CoA reductase/sulfur reductase-like enzyme